MENAVIIDADVFIRHWRTKNRDESWFDQLNWQYKRLCISAVAKYEVLAGAKAEDMRKWRQIFSDITVFAFDNATINIARGIFLQLKQDNKMIDVCDILIASTAIANDLPLATLNRNHFERIRGLRLV